MAFVDPIPAKAKERMRKALERLAQKGDVKQLTTSTRPEQLLQDFCSLPEEEQKRLLPKLLNSMRGWRLWSANPHDQHMWLEKLFEEAEVPFYNFLE